MADEFNSFEEPNIVSTMKETDKKCPSCGGTMDFDPKTGGLKCPYCDHEETIPVSKVASAAEPEKTFETAQEISLDEAENVENCDWGVATKTVLCKNCGAESVYDINTISAECPYCGSNQVMEANDKNTMAPGGVIPFKIDQKEAGNRFLAWIKGKFFAPKAAKESAKAESFKGIYLPYWTFDAKTHSTYTGEFGKDRTVREKDGSTKTVTDWFKTSGTYDEFFDDELVCGSDQHDQSLISGISYYHTSENVVYRPEYVAGFGAERYSIGVKAAWEKAKAAIQSKIRSHIESKIMKEHQAQHTRNVTVSSNFSGLTFKYLLLPVWISSFKYKDKVYQFMVNGETGHVAGQSPVSKLKVFLTIFIIVAIFALLIYGWGGR